MTEENDYTVVKIPTELANEIDNELIGKHGFKTRAEVVKEALRQFLRQYREG
jgi:metal-responsive CopG/Arc/MetJ family transcriptional regulator